MGGVEGIDASKWDVVQRAEWAAMGERGYVDLRPGDAFLFRTGFAQAIQEDHCCLLWDRSGMGGKKIVHRLAGVIDEDYRGEWFVRLVNHSSETVRVSVGDKIVQGLYTERIEAECPIVPALVATHRGAAGFGSTDGKAVIVADEIPLGEPEVCVMGTDEPQFDPGDNRPGDLVGPNPPGTGTPIVADDTLTVAEIRQGTGLDTAGPTGPVESVDFHDSFPVAPRAVAAQLVPEAAPPAPNGYRYGSMMVYDGRDAGQALACLRDRQPGAAISWM